MTSAPFPGKNAAMKNPYIGSFAVQLIKGISITVSLRSLSDGSVRLAITPGTEHPKPTSIGTILLPERPIFLSGLSMTKAILAIYPVSSSSDRKKKRIIIIGRNDTTLPTPLKIPSMISECTTSFTFDTVRIASTLPAIKSIPLSRSP